MNTNLASLVWLLFWDFLLIFSSEKVLEKQLLVLGTLMVCCFVSCYFTSLVTSSQGIQIQLFDWIQINGFKVDFGFLLDQLSIYGYYL
jgi:NADH-quinone oxidoreductase subunit L